MCAVLDPSPSGLGRRADADFVVLFARYEGRLLAFCRAILRNEHDAHDALQNTAVRALTGVRGDEVRSNPRAWMFAIARTESLMVLRRRRELAELDGTEPAAGGDPESRAIAREAFAELVSDLEALPSQARQAVVLREAAGLDYAEIARVLGCSAGAARQSVSEARAALKADRAARGADCATIRDLLDAADGRRRRTRTTRAHLRGCAACREWQATLPRRPRRLILPPFIGLGWLQTLLTGGRMELALSALTTPTRGAAAAAVAATAFVAPPAHHHRHHSHRATAPAATATAIATATVAPVARATALPTAVPRHAVVARVRIVRATATPTVAPAPTAAPTEVAQVAPRPDDHARDADMHDGHTERPWDSSTDSAAAATPRSPSTPSPPRPRQEQR